MCEFLKGLEASDWLNFFQMIIAGFSAYLLYLTFKKQGENDERAIELAEMEKKAKRAEYLPIIKTIKTIDGPLNVVAIDHSNRYDYVLPDIQKLDLSEDQDTTIKIVLFLEQGAMIVGNFNTIWKSKIDDKNLDFQQSISHSPIGKSFIYTKGNEFEFIYSINFLKVTNSRGQGGTSSLDILIKENLENSYLELAINLEDLIGNQYEIILRLHSLNELTIHEFKLKTSD